MATKVARRTQAERTEATTNALVDAARQLFARDGYDATSLDSVAARAGVTKGALYHHFEGKRQLFEAVFAREVERMARPLVAAYARKKDPSPLARFLYGALCETAMVVARADDQKAAHRQAVGEITRVLDGLAL